MTVAHESRVVVVGQGYVGLPLAVRAVEVGHTVVGFDLDKDRVDRLRRGVSFIDDITDADLEAVCGTGATPPETTRRISPTSPSPWCACRSRCATAPLTLSYIE